MEDAEMPKARRLAASEVTVSRLEPERVLDVDDTELLFEPVPQLNDPEQTFKITYEWIGPEEAKQLLADVANEPSFRQRVTDQRQVRRWTNLIKTERFVHHFPGGPLARDEQGITINGQHRLRGVIAAGQPCGFIVYHNVPRWMFTFFDTNKKRTLKDVLDIGGRSHSTFTPSALNLAIRYEEFLRGRRKADGWRHWSKVRSEHQDLDLLLMRRPTLVENTSIASKMYWNARISAPAAVVFALYQTLAWPDGADEVDEFMESVSKWRSVPREVPARVLANWAVTSWENKETLEAKRELHLSMLNRTFAQTQNNSRIGTIVWAYGHPMTMPYHPKGHAVAVDNVRQALEEMDEVHRERR